MDHDKVSRLIIAGKNRNHTSNDKGFEHSFLHGKSEKVEKKKKNLADIVLKLNRSGTRFNSRILHMEDAFLFYYTKIPKNWKDDSFDLLSDPPKEGIKLEDIEEITSPKEGKEKKKLISIKFPTKAKIIFPKIPSKEERNPILGRTNTELQEILKPNGEGRSKDCTRWIFCFDVEEKLNKWVQLIVENYEFIKNPPPEEIARKKREEEEIRLRQKKLKENEEKKKIEEEKQKKEKFKTMENKKLKEEEFLREQELKEKRLKDEEDKRKEDEKLKKEKEDEELKMKKIERQTYAENRKRIKDEWDYRYSNVFEQQFLPKYNLKDSIIEEMKIFYLVGSFRESVIEICKEIIDELCLPMSLRRNKPINAKNFHEGDMYLIENDHNFTEGQMDSHPIMHEIMVVKLAWNKLENNPLPRENPFKMEASLLNEKIFNDQYIKLLGHEFRGLDFINETLFELRKSRPDINIRAPMACIVDYKGIRALAITKPPISDDRLFVGLNKQGEYICDQYIAEKLKVLGQTMNIKHHWFNLTPQSETLPIGLSLFTEVKGIDKKRLNHIQEILKRVLDSGQIAQNEKSQSDKTQNDVLFGAESRPTDSALTNFSNLCYITRAFDIFPVEVDVETSSALSLNKKLRPEFLKQYSKQLNPDAFMEDFENPHSEEDEVELAEAGRVLRTEKLTKLLREIEKLNFIPVKSIHLTEMFHSNGINMRFLGWVAKKTSLPHIKEICLIEMVARSCKKIFRNMCYDVIAQICEENSKNQRTDYEEPQKKKKIVGDRFQDKETAGDKLRKEKLNMKIEECDKEIGNSCIDFLNLIFGKGEESENFWANMINKQVSYDFDFSVKKNDVLLAGLLFSIIYHCGFNIVFDNNLNLGKTKYPFSKETSEPKLISLEVKTKVFSLKKVNIKELSDNFRKYRENKNLEKCERALNIKLNIEKALGNPPDSTLIRDLCDLYLDDGKTDRAIEKAKEAIKNLSNPFHGEAVKHCIILIRAYFIKKSPHTALAFFNHALLVLQFHLGQFHPLNASIYSIVGKHYSENGEYEVAADLYKSSLACCFRILGSNHIQTGLVYLEIADLSKKMKKTDEALNYYRKAYGVLEVFRNAYLIKHATIGMEIAQILHQKGQFEEAAETAIRSYHTFLTDEVTFFREIVESAVFIAESYFSLGNMPQALEYGEKMREIIEKPGRKTEEEECLPFYERLFQMNCSAIFKDLPLANMSFLYCLFDSIAEPLRKEGYFPVRSENVLYYTKKQEALLEIISKAKLFKGAQQFLRDMIHTLVSSKEELVEHHFFLDYRRNLDLIKEQNLRESIADYEILIIVFGENYFLKFFETILVVKNQL